MTQEMGESLIYSWLRHVKGCQIVQTNWKVSPAWQKTEHEYFIKILENAKDWFKEVNGVKKELGFKKEKKLINNLFKTTECDVLGIKFHNSTNKIYAVEVAYHENGLDYGGARINTIEKVLSKCLRIAICVMSIFPNTPAEIYFVTPVTKNNIGKQYNFYKTIQRCFEKLNEKFGNNISFFFVSNEGSKKNIKELKTEDNRNKFNEEVIIPLIEKVDDYSDTSELFIRSIKLYKQVKENK